MPSGFSYASGRLGRGRIAASIQAERGNQYHAFTNIARRTYPEDTGTQYKRAALADLWDRTMFWKTALQKKEQPRHYTYA
jgi:hypothetical protein